MSLATVKVDNCFPGKEGLWAYLDSLDLLDEERLRPGWDTYFMVSPSHCLCYLPLFNRRSPTCLFVGDQSIFQLQFSYSRSLTSLPPCLRPSGTPTFASPSSCPPTRILPLLVSRADHQTLASLASHRSNCMKRRVGALLVRSRRILSTGYNGTPRGTKNCNHGGCRRCNGSARGGESRKSFIQ
jgi:hypothetical protein